MHSERACKHATLAGITNSGFLTSDKSHGISFPQCAQIMYYFSATSRTFIKKK